MCYIFFCAVLIFRGIVHLVNSAKTSDSLVRKTSTKYIFFSVAFLCKDKRIKHCIGFYTTDVQTRARQYVAS